ncbi:synergin gamma isoform X2 [Lingula anatina]|uniref:Synergin gamma isoform X2 n=1 Tax=Lingula anatina TaxID=7574 RepID=A0A1S3JV85_LINAN|nr:synergin gamma isoform X2 [Lingula anatina]|eukprot:XP_013413986.1 synergin gamma isoform X2 [Lingula anatina]
MANPRFPGQFPGGMSTGQPQPGFAPTMNNPTFAMNNPMMYQQQQMMGMGIQGFAPGMMPGQNQAGYGVPRYVQPPPYTPHMAQNYRQRVATPKTRHNVPVKTEEEERKERYFQQQQQKLKEFGKGKTKTVDADSLMKNIFSTDSAKPKPQKQPHQPKPQSQPQATDDFGDFLGGPSFTDSTTPSLNQSQGQDQGQNKGQTHTVENLTGQVHAVGQGHGQDHMQGEAQTVQPPMPQPKKKGLEDMMRECSDLSAPQKAKTFKGPSVKEVQPKHQAKVVSYHESNKSRSWQAPEDELSSLFTLSEPLPTEPPKTKKTTPPKTRAGSFRVPKWCTDDNLVPDLYKHVLEASVENGIIETGRLYPILIGSGLPKAVLGQIWEVANKKTPGQLIKEELYMMLALIALVQNNVHVLSLSTLEKLPHPPIPYLGQAAPQPAYHPNAGQAPQQMPPGYQTQQIPSQVPQGQAPSHVPQGPSQIPHSPREIPQGLTSSGTVPAATTNISRIQATATGDDDFEDFQAAPSIPSQSLQSVPSQTPSQIQPQPAVSVSSFAPFTNQAKPNPPTMPHSQPVSSSLDSFSPFQGTTSQTFPGSVNLEVSSVKSLQQSPIGGSAVVEGKDDDFEAFQEAPRPASGSFGDFSGAEPEQISAPQNAAPPGVRQEMNLMATEDDKYGALRGLTLEGETETKKEEADEFADFRSSSDDQGTVWTNPLPTSEGWGDLTSSGNSAVHKSEGWAAFESATAQTNTGSESEGWAEFSMPPSTVPAKVSDLSQPEGSLNLFSQPPSSQATQPLGGDSMDLFSRSPATGADLGVSLGGPSNSTSDQSSLATSEVPTDPSHLFAFCKPKPKAKTSGGIFGDSSGAQSDLSLPQDGSATVDDDFADFQDFTSSASVPSNSNSNTDPSFSADKYSIFHQVGEDTSYSSVFGQSTIPEHFRSSGADGTSDDEWDNFQAPPSLSNTAMGTDKPETAPKKLIAVKGLVDSVVEDKEKVQKEREEKKKAEEERKRQQQPTSRYVGHMSVYKQRIPQPVTIPAFDTEPPPLTDDDFGEMSPGHNDHFGHPVHHHHAVVDVDDHDDFTGWTTAGKIKKEDSQSVASLELAKSSSLSVIKQEDSQSVSSLEFAAGKASSTKSSAGDDASNSSVDFNGFDSGNNKVTGTPDEQSVGSLDLQPTVSEAEINDADDFGDFSYPSQKRPENVAPKPSSDFSSVLTTSRSFPPSVQQDIDWHTVPRSASEILAESGGGPGIGDRYSAVMEEEVQDKHAHEWQRCLESCDQMIASANNVFNSISSSSVCVEVINSEEGIDYLTGVVEIYRVVCRISCAMKAYSISTSELRQVLKSVDLSWNNLCAFITAAGSTIMTDNSFNFAGHVLKAEDENSQDKACGVCTLNVDGKSNMGEDSFKLSYGRRQYHATCANFWINAVDSTLPALKIPELL